MDIGFENIFVFLFGLAFIGLAIYCKFHPEKNLYRVSPKWPEEGQKKFAVALYFLFGLMVVVGAVLLSLFPSSKYVGLVAVLFLLSVTVLMLWLSWKYIYSQVENRRTVMLVVCSIMTVAFVAFAIYYICSFEPTAEIEAANEVKEAAEVDEIPVNSWGPDFFFWALVELVVFIRVIFCPERTRVFKNLTEEQRAKADLASYQKANAILHFLLFIILVAFGIIALYVKMRDWCMFIPVAVFLPIYFIMNRRMKAYLGEN